LRCAGDFGEPAILATRPDVLRCLFRQGSGERSLFGEAARHQRFEADGQW
jgi:hypothetical protein